MRIAIALIFLTLSGCTTVSDVNRMWGADNEKLRQGVCRKELDLEKRAAVVALVAALGQLNMLVERVDYEVGLVGATGKAPSPLSYDEFEVVKRVEGPRIQNPFFSWNTQFDISINGVVNTTAGAKSLITLNGRLDFEGNKEMIEPVSELPPKALELACRKIFEEIDRTAFKQNRTLADQSRPAARNSTGVLERRLIDYAKAD